MKKRQRAHLQTQFLATCGTLGNGPAMEALGLSRYTLYSWLHNPDFKARYDALMATYTFHYQPPTDEEWEENAKRLRMMPARDLMRIMRQHNSDYRF